MNERFMSGRRRRLKLARRVRRAVDQLRAVIGADAVPEALRHVKHVSAGEEGDVEPAFVIVIAERGYESVVRDFLTAHLSTVMPAAAVEPSGALRAPGAEPLEVVVAEEQPRPRAVRRHNLDPKDMIGLDVDVAAQRLGADGWTVRRIEDEDAVTADLNRNRANLHHHTSADRVVYDAHIG